MSSTVVEGRHPIFDLLSRYSADFGTAWAHRAELAGPRRMADEIAFLPAALSLQETPVHPAPRRVAWALRDGHPTASEPPAWRRT